MSVLNRDLNVEPAGQMLCTVSGRKLLSVTHRVPAVSQGCRDDTCGAFDSGAKGARLHLILSNLSLCVFF